MILFKENSFYLWSPSSHDTKPTKLLTDTSCPQDILFAKISMDSQLLALLSSPKSVIVHDMKIKKQWKITIKNIAGNQILPEGIIWSEHGGNSQDLAVVTSKGIELHKVSSARGQCKLSRSIMQNTHFFCYEPNFRALLLGSMTRDNTIEITGFFLRYDLSDAPRLELPPPDKMPVFRLDVGAGAQDVKLIVLYGTLYLSVHYSGDETDSLVLYDLSRGKSRITKTFSYPLYMSSDVHVSVTDNLLCCHCLQSQLTFLLDVRLCDTDKVLRTENNLNSKSKKSGTGNGSGANVSFGACTLVVDEEVERALKEERRDGTSAMAAAGGINNITSPVKKLLQGSDDEKDIAKRGGKQQRNENEKVHVPSIAALSLDSSLSSPEGQVELEGHEDTVISGNIMKEKFDTLFVQSLFGATGSSAKFEYDNDVCVSSASSSYQQNHQQQPRSHCRRHVQEPYNNQWQFLTPNWVWNPHDCHLWKIKCNFSAVVSTVQSAERMVHFLSARGLPIEAPRPVYQSDCEDGGDAKALLFYKLFRGIVDKQSATWC
jgi:hypothetical protein